MTTRTCPNCGSPVAPGERFCGECGADLTTFPTAAKAVGPSPDSSTPATQTADNAYSSGAVTSSDNTPTGAPTTGYTPPSVPQSGVYTNTAQQNYTNTAQQNYGAAATPASGPGAMFWVGLVLLALGLLACVGIFALGMASVGTATTVDDANSTRLGTWICSVGLLLLLGIPGALLLFLGRKK